MSNSSLLLCGLDGSNPLAFLAALGTLHTLTRALEDKPVKMGWEQYKGTWRPTVNIGYSPEELISILAKSLKTKRDIHASRFVGDDPQISSFYERARKGERFESELDQWMVALTSDIHPNATSQLQLTRRDYFAGNLDEILANTTADSLYRALFQPWRYDDKLSGQSLHLEPSEDRRHAYQWNRPSGDPNRNKSGNMLGANRLAIEAIPLFFGLPSKNPDRLLVIGWTGVRSEDSRWTWPIWSPQIEMPIVRSLIGLKVLQNERPDIRELRARGIMAAYRCRRILVEQTPNLTPAFAIG